MSLDYSEIEEIINSNKRMKNILIIGSNFPPEDAEKRDKVIGHFRLLGYKKTIKMEEIIKESKDLDKEFFSTFKQQDAIVAILSRTAYREGVCWELGFMQGLSYHDMESLYDKLFVCIQGGVADITASSKDAVTKMVSAGLLRHRDLKIIPFENNNSLLKEALAQIESHFIGGEYGK